MTDLMLRRRELMAPQDSAPKYAVDRKTNAPLMDICYAQGWAANEDYMTFEEAAKPITVSGNPFQWFTGTSLYELGYFTNLTNKSNQYRSLSVRVLRIYPINKNSVTDNPQVGARIDNTNRRLIDFGENITGFWGWCFDYLLVGCTFVFRSPTVVTIAQWDIDGTLNCLGKGGNTLYVPDNLVSAYEESVFGQKGNTIKPLSEYDEKKLVKQYLNQ